jgi:hypothetical protein
MGFIPNESARRRAVIFPGDVVEVNRPTTDVTDKVGAGDGAGTGARKVEP